MHQILKLQVFKTTEVRNSQRNKNQKQEAAETAHRDLTIKHESCDADS